MKSFKEIAEQDPELKADQAQLQKLRNDKAEKSARADDLVTAIESATSDVAELANALVTGGEVFNPVVVNGLREEREQLLVFLRALDVAIPRLDKKIQARISALGQQYAKSREGEQLGRAHKTLDMLLTLADISKQERALRAEAEAEGCAGHYFKHFALVIRGSELTGSFHTEARFLEALFGKYEAIGLPPTNDHRKRLAALANQG